MLVANFIANSFFATFKKIVIRNSKFVIIIYLCAQTKNDDKKVQHTQPTTNCSSCGYAVRGEIGMVNKQYKSPSHSE